MKIRFTFHFRVGWTEVAEFIGFKSALAHGIVFFSLLIPLRAFRKSVTHHDSQPILHFTVISLYYQSKYYLDLLLFPRPFINCRKKFTVSQGSHS